jgi:FRG domain
LRSEAKHKVTIDKVNSVEEFLGFLSGAATPGQDHWFRGHACEGWSLSASVFRSSSRTDNEVVLLKRFIQEARRHIDDVPSGNWDWVFLAQHHNVPTRLLDWSEGPLVGLYFAAQDHLDIPGDDASARDGEVWMLKPTVMNAKLGFTYTGRDLPMFDLDADLDDYSPFDGSGHRRSPVAALAARNFRRISAQWGTFTVCNVDQPLDLLPERDDFLTSLRVPIAAKSSIREQLARLGLEDRTIYPDLFRLGQRLTEVYT